MVSNIKLPFAVTPPVSVNVLALALVVCIVPPPALTVIARLNVPVAPVYERRAPLSMVKLPVPIMLLPATLGNDAVVSEPPLSNKPPVNELDALLKVKAPAPNLVSEVPLPLITSLNVDVVLVGLLTVKALPPPVTVLAKVMLPDVVVEITGFEEPIVAAALKIMLAPVAAILPSMVYAVVGDVWKLLPEFSVK